MRNPINSSSNNSGHNRGGTFNGPSGNRNWSQPGGSGGGRKNMVIGATTVVGTIINMAIAGEKIVLLITDVPTVALGLMV